MSSSVLRSFLLGLILLAPFSTSYSQVGNSIYDFGDHTSVTLVTKAWDSLTQKDFNAVAAYTKKCIELYGQKAVEQQASLTDFAPSEKAFDYWALNDVGTAYFILGKAYREQGASEKANEAFKKVISDYGYAQCWDNNNKAHWQVAQASKDQIDLLDSSYDFGDYTSEFLTTQAWKSLGKKDFTGVETYTKKCVALYEEEAMKMQQALTDYPPKDRAFNYWALNDVGTSYFILGEALSQEEKYQEAIEVFQVIVDNFSFAQTWDPKGWFWKPAVVARGRINKIRAEQDL